MQLLLKTFQMSPGLLVLRVYLLVFEVDFLSSDAAPASLELPRPLLQDAEFFISEW